MYGVLQPWTNIIPCRLNDLALPEIKVAGNLMLTGCTGGNAGIDAISSGTFGQANWTLEVELIDGK